MAGYQRWEDDGGLKSKIEAKDSNHDLFKKKLGHPSLQVNRVWVGVGDDGKSKLLLESKKNVGDTSQINGLKDASDSTQNSFDILQVFSVSQERSWTTLDISRETFEMLLEAYTVFPQFWRCVLSFGRKSEENEFEFPGFRAKCSPISGARKGEIYELAYVLRRVELNQRVLSEGQSPWSIRQTAVYHKLYLTRSSLLGAGCDEEDSKFKWRSVFILLAPSPHFEQQLGHYLRMSAPDEDISPWEVHRQIVAESLENWLDYMAYLEEEMRGQSDRIVFASVGTERENLSPLTDFNINFVDRQTLKILEDSIIDLQIILPTILSTITGVRDQCRKSSRRCDMDEEKSTLEFMIDQFDEYINVARYHVEKAKILKDRVTAIAQLLSDLLSYEEAVALKDLSRESYKEGKEMHRLTERSTKDAAAVKILTVITLIYLPTTIVANFFSTQFVQTNDSGHMKLNGNAWLLAAISVPLTILTLAIWAIWVYFTKMKPILLSELPSPPNILRRSSARSVRSVLSWKKSRQPHTLQNQKPSTLTKIFSAKSLRHRDIELALSNSALRPANVSRPAPTATWSSDTTTIE